MIVGTVIDKEVEEDTIQLGKRIMWKIVKAWAEKQKEDPDKEEIP